ncbi:MAG: hypothetical protein KF834_06700 [Burkholderiales bacterium]|nr:hypothetical protein [Burkholderiales bacterium]
MANPLDIGRVISGAFIVPWVNRRTFSRVLAVPISALLLLALIEQHTKTLLSAPAGILFTVIQTAAFSIFAVRCHRLVLLEENAPFLGAIPVWSKRETRFFLWICAIALVFLVSVIGSLTLLAGISNVFMDTKSLKPFSAGIFIILGILTYLFARISVIFPAIALDQNINLQSAWRQTRANGWRLVFVVGITPWVISEILDLASRDDGSPLETLILTFAACASAVFVVTALSLSYGELLKKEDHQKMDEQS